MAINNSSYYLFILFRVRCGSLAGLYRLYILYKENPPIAYLEVKTLQVCRKKALPKAQRPKVRKNPYLIIPSYLLSIEGFACPCFTNVSARYNTISTCNICLVVYLLPSSFFVLCTVWVKLR